MCKGKLLLIGGGGHCRSVIDSIDTSIYGDIVIIDLPEKVGQVISNIKIVGTDNELQDLFLCGYTNASITISNLASQRKRVEIYKKLKSFGYTFPTIIDATAIVSDTNTVIEEGVFIGKGVIINTSVHIGAFSIINSGAVIDHDVKVGRFSHIAPGAILSGYVMVGDYSHVGTGSSVIQSVSIGNRTIIGAGSVVVRDIPCNITAFGNPCVVQKSEGVLL